MNHTQFLSKHINYHKYAPFFIAKNIITFLRELTQQIRPHIDTNILFLHAPKTAGSSFRKAAETYFTTQNTYYDYGKKSAQTHPKILELDYQNQDRFAAGTYIMNHAQFLSGHINYHKYAPFFMAKNIITFLREPSQRIRSNFEHYARHYNYKENFESFIQDKKFSNLQSRVLKGLPASAYGFIGITEEYNTSIELINTYYKIDIKALSLNKNESKKTGQYQFTDAELFLIKQHNQDDIKLYSEAYELFLKQKQAIQKQRALIRFGLLPIPPKQQLQKINGWLTTYESSEVEELEVHINKIVVAKVTANEYSPWANERNINRSGFIGFTYNFPKNIKHGDLIELVSKSTQETLYSTEYNAKQDS